MAIGINALRNNLYICNDALDTTIQDKMKPQCYILPENLSVVHAFSHIKKELVETQKNKLIK
jgi:hypothetical protein